MPPATLPPDEQARLQALTSYGVLDAPPEQSLNDLVALTARVLGMPAAAISLVGETRQWFIARHGLDVPSTPRDGSFGAHAILTPDRPLVVEDTTRDPRFADNPLVLGPVHLRCYAGMPLVTPDGHAIGVLCALDRVPRQLGKAQVANLRDIARAVSTTLELRRLAEENRRLALTDALTGLPNRPALMEALEREIARQIREGGRFGLMLLDLDGFKALNDSQGHPAGDAALRLVGQALRGALRRSDLPARIGGDEFAVLLPATDPDITQARVDRAGDRVREAIAREMTAHGWGVTASVGAIAFLRPPAAAAEALKQADVLLYAAKAAGRNRVASPEPVLRALPQALAG